MAKKLGVKLFYVSSFAVNGSYTGASDFNTNALELSENGEYILYLGSTHTTGTPKVTLQCSDDGTNWFNYKLDAVDVALPEVFLDDEFFPRYIRIAYTANSSNGNLSFKISFVQ